MPAFEQEPVVVGTFSDTSAARESRIEAGDRIVTVDGTQCRNWDQLSIAVGTKAKREVTRRLHARRHSPRI